MAATNHPPGARLQTLPAFPPGIVQIPSAVPVFIGLTERATAPDGRSVLHAPVAIASMAEVKSIFGGPPAMIVNQLVMLSTTGTTADKVLSASTSLPSVLYHSLELYFANGGGPCCVVSIGAYGTTLKRDLFIEAVNTLAEVPEPTLIVLSDAVLLPQAADYSAVATAALGFIAGEPAAYRFLLLDLQEYGTATSPFNYADPKTPYYQSFRDGIGINHLDYAAAYTPYLQALVSASTNYTQIAAGFAASKSALAFPAPPDGVVIPAAPISVAEEASLRSAWPAYRAIAEAVEALSVLLPPSGALAGIYVATDASRGFWQAPANVSINNVADVAWKIDDSANSLLNTDSVAGKSINAIRFFAGQGILVWGAHTLDGNSQDWRYIPARRTASIIEQSIKNSLQWAVFEPNDARLWQRVNGMIDNYLTGLWRQGALQGPSPSQAFSVSVGLGTTMTAQDILEGRMIISLALAVVRPAEFIIVQIVQATAAN